MNRCSKCNADPGLRVPSGFCGNCGAIWEKENTRTDIGASEPDFGVKIPKNSSTDQRSLRGRRATIS